MSNNILSFSQNFNSNGLTASPGATSHLIPWKYIGTDESVQLFGFDSSANKWFINLLSGTIENDLGATTSLRYMTRANEFINLQSFFCTDIKLTINPELNELYKLENLYLSETSNRDRNIMCTEVDSNNYFFKVDSLLSISDGSKALRFNLKLRENCDNDDNDSQKQIRHDPRYTELIKVQLNGYTKTYNVFNVSSTGTIDLRQYSKRLYIKDGTENGYLKYDKINKKYCALAALGPTGGTTGATPTTTFVFNIVDSSLYNIKVEEAGNTSNNVTIPELKIRGGKCTCSIDDASLFSLNESIIVEYCELYLYDSELNKVPNNSEILIITKS